MIGEPRVVSMVGALAVAFCAAASGRAVLRAAPRNSRLNILPWQLFGASLVAWAGGALLTFVSLLFTEEPPTGGSWLSNIGYMAATALYLLAIVLHPALQPRVVRLRALANAVIVASSAATVLWYVAGRQLHATSGSALDTLATLLYPVSDVVLIFLGVITVHRIRRTGVGDIATARVATALLTVAFAAFAAGDLRELLWKAHGIFAGAPLLTETAWILGFVSIALSMGVARRGVGDFARQLAADADLTGPVTLMPVLSAVLAGVTALMDWAVSGTIDSIGLLMLTAVVTMVLARQSITLSDNQLLGESLQRAVADLQHQATHDSLTGLPNRAALTARFDATLASGAGTGRQAALLFIDLDRLKPVNDSLGHGAGDQLLQITASRIRSVVGECVSRFGGDEFVVLLEDLPRGTAAATAEQVGSRILGATAEPVEILGHVIIPSVSVGIALGDADTAPEELMRRADLALYRAKANGRSRIATYDECHHSDARELIDLEHELRRAMQNDELEVHYQPVIDLATGQVDGVESLLRWRHPTRGLLTPDQFLEAAASSGLLGAIGERTLRRACADVASLQCVPGDPLPFVSVNLSTTELTDRRAVRRVRDALRNVELNPERLVIEITEDVVVDDTIRQTIDELRSLGVQLAIDDFGTGNSSLRQLGTYPAGTLKIDRSFISPIGADPHAGAIVRAILGLARNLGLRTVAEGVETVDQARMLSAMGCESAQGWLFAAAMPIDELEQHLRTRPSRLVQPASRSNVSTASEAIRSSSSSTVGRSSITPTT